MVHLIKIRKQLNHYFWLFLVSGIKTTYFKSPTVTLILNLTLLLARDWQDVRKTHLVMFRHKKFRYIYF